MSVYRLNMFNGDEAKKAGVLEPIRAWVDSQLAGYKLRCGASSAGPPKDDIWEDSEQGPANEGEEG
jgi:hypothetical protein